MRITYDKSVDALYISTANEVIPNRVKQTDSFEIKNLLEFGVINIDFDEDKKIVGFEILNASRHIPKKILDDAERIG